jgi:hypothetical protein
MLLLHSALPQFPARSPNFTGTSIFFPPRYTVTATVSPGLFLFNATFKSN